MFGFFKNHNDEEIQYDKEIQFLKNIIEALDKRIFDQGHDIEALRRRVEFVENKAAECTVTVENFDERLKKIESLLNEPSCLKQEIVEEITTTKAILEVLKKQEKELPIKCIFDMIKKYNLKNPHVTKNSLKALLYRLRRDGRIDYGKEQGTFKGVPGIYC